MKSPEFQAGMQRLAVPLALLLLLVSFGLGLGSALEKSATRDEGVHLARGAAILKTGDFRLSIHHPPLMNLLSALPLILSGRPLIFPDQDPSWQNADKDRFAEVLAQANRPNLLFFLQLGRLPSLLLSALLGWFVFRFSRELFGLRAAFLSLTLYCFDPTVLAHARLITTDLAVTAGTFFVVYAAWRFYQKPSPQRLILLFVLLGLALLTKYSAVLLVPLVLILLAAAYFRDAQFAWDFHLAWKKVPRLSRRDPFWTLFLACGLGLLLTGLVVWAGYGFDLSPFPWSSYLRGFLTTEAMLHPEARLHSEAMPYHNYFFGQLSDHGFRSYYLVLFLLKTPIATLLLLALSFLPFGERKTPSALPQKLLPLFIFLPALTFFLAASFLNDLNLGVRYVLPAYPLLFVWIGRLLPEGAKLPRWRHYLIPALAGWTIAACLWIWPHYLMYWNPLSGGPDRAWKISVVGEDWGQDVALLARYVNQHNIQDLHYNLYGIGTPALYGLRYRTFPCQTPVKGWVAVHMVDLYRPRSPGCYDWLKAEKPVAKVGYTIWVYRIE
jgi:4-amino-4-deoxy-L-arabinose transferase-like glycosyltransferase